MDGWYYIFCKLEIDRRWEWLLSPSVSESSWWTGWPACQPAVEGGRLSLWSLSGKVWLILGSRSTEAESDCLELPSKISCVTWRRSRISRDILGCLKKKKEKQMTQGCFRTWPSCTCVASGIYWSIWENKSVTLQTKRKDRTRGRSCCRGCPSQQQCLALLSPDNQGRRPPGSSHTWSGEQGADAGQKPCWSWKDVHLAYKVLGSDYSASSWSPFLCFSILPQASLEQLFAGCFHFFKLYKNP